MGTGGSASPVGGNSSTFENRRTLRGSRGARGAGGVGGALGFAGWLAGAAERGTSGVEVVAPKRCKASAAVMVALPPAALLPVPPVTVPSG